MKEESPFPEGYLGSTKAVLDHEFGNKVWIVALKLKRTDGDPAAIAPIAPMAERNKNSFIAGLRNAL